MSEFAERQAGSSAQRRGQGLWLLRLSTTGLTAIALAFLAGFLFFVDHVASLDVPPRLHPADGIVVLTGGQSRIDTGLELLKAGKGKRLLISGVNPVARIDDLRVATGGDRSLFDCCVDIDRAALNTIGNAEESAKWASANTYGSIIVVTNNYHMPRSLLEMRRILPMADLQPYPVVNTPLSDGIWLKDADALRVLFTEYIKYVAAFLRIHLAGLQDPQPTGGLAGSVAAK